MPNIDVDIDDILWSMSDREKQELVDDLYYYGYIPTNLKKSNSDSDFDEACEKLKGNNWRLTKEEEAFITKVSGRFI